MGGGGHSPTKKPKYDRPFCNERQQDTPGRSVKILEPATFRLAMAGCEAGAAKRSRAQRNAEKIDLRVAALSVVLGGPPGFGT